MISTETSNKSSTHSYRDQEDHPPAERREHKDFLLNLVMEDVEDEQIKMEFRKLTELQAEVKECKVEAKVRAKMEAMSTTAYPLLDNKPAVNPATAPGPLITTQQAGAVGFVAPALLAPDAFLLGTVIDELLTAEELEDLRLMDLENTGGPYCSQAVFKFQFTRLSVTPPSSLRQ